MLDYKLAFTHCSDEVLDYEMPTCVVSVGNCLRDLHPVSFIAEELRQAWDKDICLPSQVLGALNLIRLLNYTSERCCTAGLLENTLNSTQLLFCDSWQCSPVKSTASSGSTGNQYLQHLQYFLSSKGSSGCKWAGHKALLPFFPVCFWSLVNSAPLLLSQMSVGTTSAWALSECQSEALPEQIIMCLFITRVIFSLLSSFFFFFREESNIKAM